MLSVGRRVYESSRVLAPGCDYALERPGVPGAWSASSRTLVRHADRLRVPNTVLEEAQIYGDLLAVLVHCGRDLVRVEERGDRDPDVVLREVLAGADAVGAASGSVIPVSARMHIPPSEAERGAARVGLWGAPLASQETVWVEGLGLRIDAGIV